MSYFLFTTAEHSFIHMYLIEESLPLPYLLHTCLSIPWPSLCMLVYHIYIHWTEKRKNIFLYPIMPTAP